MEDADVTVTDVDAVVAVKVVRDAAGFVHVLAECCGKAVGLPKMSPEEARIVGTRLIDITDPFEP